MAVRLHGNGCRIVALASLSAGLWGGLSGVAAGADPFRERIVPFVETYCAECHNDVNAEAQLDLTKYDSAEAAARDFRQWEHVVTFLQRKEMPPESAGLQLSDALRRETIDTIRTIFASEARKQAGDPGVVLPRRLSNAEYDHTVRDLTGVDIRPTQSFPVDPAAGEGFNNTGEALTMSPALFAKLYAAAQHVADHALLTTEALEFAPFPVVTFADRRKFFETAILEFYETRTINYERVLTACWEYRHRPADRQDATLAEWAEERKLSAKYLTALDELLNGDPAADAYYVGWLRGRWQALPGPKDGTAIPGEVRDAIRVLSDDIRRLSQQLCPPETEAIVANAGNAPIDHLARRRKTAAERNSYNATQLAATRRLHREFHNLDKQETLVLTIRAAVVGRDTKPDAGAASLKSLNFSRVRPQDYRPNDDKQNFPLRKLLMDHAPDQLERLNVGADPLGETPDPEAVVLPAGKTIELEIPTKVFPGLRDVHFYVEASLDREQTPGGLLTVAVGEGKAKPEAKPAATTLIDPASLLVDPDLPGAQAIKASGAAFCRLFPNRFYFADETRGLSAGFHLIEGYFRDDQPLCDIVLSDAERRELDQLWSELEFVTEIAERQLRGFVFFERSERNFLKDAVFDPFKEEDPKLVEPEMLDRFESVYLTRAGVKQPVENLDAHPIHIFFEQTRQGLQNRRERLRKAEPAYLARVEEFAHAAYRRPLTTAERDDLRTFYQDVAGQPEFGIEQAVRASLVRILMSPYFGVRLDPLPEGDTVRPLPDLALASRLSYFLWSSLPDAELRSLAEAGKLHDEEVLLAQTRRMLGDRKTADFAREFFGQWLGYRDFPQQESVDRQTFRDFDEDLKRSMYEEPTRFAAHLIQQNRPITDLLVADATFVDQRLAKHYGLPFQADGDAWQEVAGLKGQGRGGILGMAVFLTKNSQPQRTSPVKRGFWVVHKVLGEHIPAPPADVVALPAKETDTNGKTIRQLLAQHVEAVKCARCHVRFDDVGLSMEGFDTIGRRRTQDLAGRPVDDAVKLPDGMEARGVPAFAQHLVRTRRDDFTRTFCRKLLGYALGRSLQLSDDVLLEEMQTVLKQHDDRLVPLIETIVRSPQFRNQRCRDFTAAKFKPE